ncbi:MAG: HPF/RaiA family ribosome-associated protein [Candidatus Omnitrophica bacterium]|nr:HPF/RaiA family ribosome-associated protein [Candidatus Omnitrophota bacterium]
MKKSIEIKHVGPREVVQQLLEERIERLANKLRHFPPDSLSLHVLFDENAPRRLYRVAVSCHLPKHTVAAREERHQAGEAIKEAFAELERQLEKQKAFVRREHLRSRERRQKQPQMDQEPE